jgi:FO synthase subunit 2
VVNHHLQSVLERCLEGHDLGVDDAVLLCAATGDDLETLRCAANTLRVEQVGDVVTYVVNRNINFTNICIKSCSFCAFARSPRSPEGYSLSRDEVIRLAVEARDLGASEVCLQAGLAPCRPGDRRAYAELCRAVKRAAPELHLHAFSPEEVKYGAALAQTPVREYLRELMDAGLGSLPGTSAEVLDDNVRHLISPDRMSTCEWVHVIRTAHELGLRTTATIMFGHIESDLDRVRHLDLLRSLQRETGGFTELVPLSFVHVEAPLFRTLPGVRPGPSHDDVVRLFAIARLMLGSTFRNIQASWVKQGVVGAAELLDAGANDLGGTLINESISTAAGAGHGQIQTPATLRTMARERDRAPAERDTLYRIRRRFSKVKDCGEDRGEPVVASYSSLRETRPPVQMGRGSG